MPICINILFILSFSKISEREKKWNQDYKKKATKQNKTNKNKMSNYMVKYETIKSNEYLLQKVNCTNDCYFYEIGSYYYIQFKTDSLFYYKIQITDDMDNKNFECLSIKNYLIKNSNIIKYILI